MTDISNMTETSQTEPASGEDKAEHTPLRVVLLADDTTLQQYGPVLRRLTVGLYDEVASLTLVCKGRSNILEFVPSPPINIISDISSLYETLPAKEDNDLMTVLYTPRLNIPELFNRSARIDRLAAELSSRQVTLIHSLSERMEKLAAELSKRLKIPYITSILSENHNSLNPKESKCGHIMPCYSHIARKLRQKYPDYSEKIHLVEIGTHVNNSTSCYDFGDRWAQIFCCCPLEKNMGVPELIKAAKILNDCDKEFQIMIAGKGKMEFEYRRMVNSMGLGQKVHFIDPIDSLIADNEAFRKVFRMADIYVQCRPSRTWHPELLEAMSAGNAVVAVGETEHSLLIDETTALLCNLHHPEDMAEKLGKLIDDRKYARELANQCQNYIKKHFLASEMVGKLVKAYKMTLESVEEVEECVSADVNK